MRIPLVLTSAILLGGCLGSQEEPFPSLLPRPAETARDLEIRAVSPGGLSAEERAALDDDLVRAEAGLAQAAALAETEGKMLDTALAAARGAQAGDSRWVDAQVALSRFDRARMALGESRQQVSGLLLRADALPADDPERARVDTLVRRLDAAEQAASARTSVAEQRLRPAGR